MIGQSPKAAYIKDRCFHSMPELLDELVDELSG
jgi:hypothetical protein